MNSPSPSYEYKATPRFEKELKKLRKKAPMRAKKIQNAIQNILEQPYRNVDFGKGIWQGKRKYRVGNDRITFVVCKQCRKLEHQEINQCGDCNNTPDETVIFVYIIEGHKY